MIAILTYLPLVKTNHNQAHAPTHSPKKTNPLQKKNNPSPAMATIVMRGHPVPVQIRTVKYGTITTVEKPPS